MTITAAEYLEIDGVPLFTYGWETVDLSELWAGGDVRGTDRLIPGAAGVRPYPRRTTVSIRSVPMVVYGHTDADGVPYADVRAGLEANLDFLRANVTDPTNVGDGTRTATLHLPSGATRTGDVHVVGFSLSPVGPAAVRAVLSLSIPGGVLS